MSTIRYYLDPDHKLTDDEVKEIEAAARQPIVYDEDSPSFTMEELHEMAEAMKKKRAEERKPVISLRINPETLEKAKATGKGYTGFLSRLLDNAINDPEMVKKSL